MFDMFEKEGGKTPIDSTNKQKLLQFSVISLHINSYDDIFSDFDPRQYGEKALSEDFLEEAKRATRDTKEGIELRFLVPAEKRNYQHEFQIKKRLHDHFRRHHEIMKKEVSGIVRKGIIMAIFGVILIMIATYLATKFAENTFWVNFLIIILEPGGWFTAWTGLDQLFYTKNERSPDLKFYEKMSRADISFWSY